jgi:hypothetical protein
MSLQEYEMVRVRQLLSSPEDYDGWCVNLRPPRIGDIGTVLNTLEAPGLPARYVVESSQPDGITVWFSDFQEEELECIER